MSQSSPEPATPASAQPASTAPSVRAATLEDAERFLAVFHWLMEPPGAHLDSWDDHTAAAAMRRVISSASSAALFAELAGELVGGCTVYLDILSVRFGQRAWVEDLAVHPGHRSSGIGTLLLDAAKSWARERGATHLELESSEKRHDAHRFYRAQDPTWVSRCFWWEL